MRAMTSSSMHHLLLLGLACATSSCFLDRQPLQGGTCAQDHECGPARRCVAGECVHRGLDAGPRDAALADALVDARTDTPVDSGDAGRAPGPLLNYRDAQFSRSSPATHFDSASGTLTRYAVDEPRILADGSIYLEGSRTNHALYAQRLDQPLWNVSAATVSADAVEAPDGTRTAELWETINNINAYVIQIPLALDSGPATLSLFARASAATESARLYCRSPVATDLFGPDFEVGTTWERQSLVAEQGIWRPGIFQPTASAQRALGLFGAQTERGAFPSQYIETVDAPATRAADIALFGSTPPEMRAGVWTISFAPEASSPQLVTEGASMTLFAIGSDASNRIDIEVDGGTVQLAVYAGGDRKVASAPLTFRADSEITMTINAATGVLAVRNAETGNGPATGGAWSWTDGDLHLGRLPDGSQPYFGRLGEPQAP